jgi:transposase
MSRHDLTDEPWTILKPWIPQQQSGPGRKVMMVADGKGLPIELHVASARPHDSTLAEPTLATVNVPNGVAAHVRGRRRWWPTRVMTARPFANSCGGGV